MTAFPNAQNLAAGAIPVWVTGGPGGGATPKAGTVSSIATGGTAVTVVTGPINGGFITNPINAAAQGIVTAENLYVDITGVTPPHTDAAAGANGTTVILLPGQSLQLPGLASGVTVQANATTNGHNFTVNVW